MKRFISIFVLISMIFSLTAPAFATEANSSDNAYTYIGNIENGNIFLQKTESKSITILTNNTDHIIHISIAYADDPNNVYQWIFDDYPVSDFSSDNSTPWLDIIQYAENNTESATIITFTHSDPTSRSSASADLQEDMADLLGSEYSNRLVTTRITSSPSHTYRLYETMTFYVTDAGTITWKDAITVASFITSIIGTVTTSGTVALVCNIFGISSSVATAIIPSGSAKKYSCSAQYYRYVTIDGSTRKYAEAYKYVHYYGYEDANLSSTERAYLIPATEMTWYDPDSEYFFVDGIFDEAYNTYYNIL